MLPSGKVLLAGGEGGSGWVPTTELYDPATGKWSTNGTLTYPRWSHTATLLPSGEVLVAGGMTNGFYPPIMELFALDLGLNSAWQPQIVTATSLLNLGDSVALTGLGFRGVSGGSGGNTQDSPTDTPLLQLRSLDSSRSSFLLPASWSSNSFISVPIYGFPPGYSFATLFVNGIQSTSTVLNITVAVPTPTTLGTPKMLGNRNLQFGFTNTQVPSSMSWPQRIQPCP